MAYTLEKTLEGLSTRLGTYNKASNSWRLGKSQFTRYMHSPLSEVPVIRHLFEH